METRFLSPAMLAFSASSSRPPAQRAVELSLPVIYVALQLHHPDTASFTRHTVTISFSAPAPQHTHILYTAPWLRAYVDILPILALVWPSNM
jgi:hypothetical protein